MTASSKYDVLKLESQLCFPLYACAKEVVRRYTPYLDELGLTYTQYIAMMVLWEERQVSVRELGERLFLDSGTLTPLLKKLEAKGYVERKRCAEDERKLQVTLTEAGLALRDRAVEVPTKVSSCLKGDAEDLVALYGLLNKLLGQLKDSEACNPCASRG